jgi:hypothetical protein
VSWCNFPALIESSGIDLIGMTNAQKVDIAEYVLKKTVINIVDSLPLSHYCEDGIYFRTIFLPKNTLLTGKVHNFDHISHLTAGRVSIFTRDGLEHRYAPDTWESLAGTKRLIFVHEDTIWTTSHTTNETEIPALEAQLVHDSDLSWIDEYKLLSGDIT